jgi:ribosomal protein S6
MTFLVSHEASVEDVQKITDHYSTIIVKFGGVLVMHEYWGLRSVFHEIKGSKKAHFIFLKVKCSVKTLDKVKEDYRYNESILKGFELKVSNSNNITSPLAVVNDSK